MQFYKKSIYCMNRNKKLKYNTFVYIRIYKYNFKARSRIYKFYDGYMILSYSLWYETVDVIYETPYIYIYIYTHTHNTI